MIREATAQTLRDQLAHPPYLAAEDFELKTANDSNGTIVTISYRFGTDESFSARIPMRKTKEEGHYQEDFKIACSCNPGELTKREMIVAMGLEELRVAVREWSSRIADDLRSLPAMRALAEQRARLEELEERLEGLPAEPASAEQLQRIQEWLTTVETEMRARVEALELDSKEKDKQLKAIAEEIAFLKSRAATTTVANAVRTIFNRFHRAATSADATRLLDNGVKAIALLEAVRPK